MDDHFVRSRGTNMCDANDTSTDDKERQIKLTERQRKRIDRIKRAHTDGGNLSGPSDQDIIEGLLDTWDTVVDKFERGRAP